MEESRYYECSDSGPQSWPPELVAYMTSNNIATCQDKEIPDALELHRPAPRRDQQQGFRNWWPGVQQGLMRGSGGRDFGAVVGAANGATADGGGDQWLQRRDERPALPDQDNGGDPIFRHTRSRSNAAAAGSAATPPPQPSRQAKKRRTGTWTNDQLVAAVAAVDAGTKVATAGRVFGIPASSLRDHIHGRTLQRKKGRQGVLTMEEEAALVKWILDMQGVAHPISIIELRSKVSEITQERWTPFTDGIPGRGWLRWFRNRNPELTLRQPQGLDEGRARGLNPTSVASFYDNLKKAYEKQEYPPSHIWNADESGAQAGRSGGGTLVFAKKGTRSVHSTVPNNREHLTVLTCVNATGEYIPNFYIFKGKRKVRDYVRNCEPDACMAMQPNGWMTAFLFLAWIEHFIPIVREKYGLSPENRHVLILDGHGSHVTLDVVLKATVEGLDIITLPSHTSHKLQPLDVSIFKSFKVGFRKFRDRWTVQNKGKAAQKEDLAQWVALGLKKALTPANITKGFSATGIWPLQPTAMDNFMQPSSCYTEAEACVDEADDDEMQDAVAAVASSSNCIPGTLPQPAQYFVPAEDDSNQSSEERTDSECEEGSTATDRNLFPLPQLQRSLRKTNAANEPLIDYSKSIIMTSNDYIAAMQEKAARKAAVALEREQKKKESEEKKALREEEKARKETEKVMKRIQSERKKAEKELEKARKACEKAMKKREADQRRRRGGGGIAQDHGEGGGGIAEVAGEGGDGPCVGRQRGPGGAVPFQTVPGPLPTGAAAAGTTWAFSAPANAAGR